MASRQRPVVPFRRRRHRKGVVVTVILVAILAVVGALVGVYLTYSAGERNQLSTVRRQLDGVPLPAGAMLTDTISNGANGDAAAYLERRYKLPSTTPGTQIRAKLAAAGFRIVPMQAEGPALPVSSADWSTYASANTGDVEVRPPRASSGGIEMQWDGDKLFISLQAGDLS